ncbi:MAG: alpha-L-fucosidase, partial [Verrucomicrobia bacterium]|nr:alpha-L-fucosidase [Verrucomicrobiota bacterium]
MKRILHLITVAVGFGLLHALPLQAGDYGEKYENYPVDAGYKHAPREALEAWRDRKYGMRIVWGVYSILGVQASWPLTGGSGQFGEKYQALYKDFNPTDFNGDRWAELMKRSGFKYFTFVTKHHDGFAMWDTKTKVKKRFIQSGPQAGRIEDCDLHYDMMETPFGRDILKELIDATRERGISTGLYFSHADWYDADFRLDKWNPHRDPNYSRQTDPEGWKRFIARHREQVRELLTNYGNVEQFVWVLCFVIYNMAGIASYDPKAENYKPVEWVLKSLIDTVAKGGNFMPMLGPDAKGNFQPVAVERLERVGRWLAVNGEAIYQTRPYWTWNDGDSIRYTRSKDGRTVYAICLKWPGRELKLVKVRAREGSPIRMLGFDQPLAWRQDPSGLTVEIPDRLDDERQRPCELAYAFKIEPEAPVNPAAVAVPGYASGLEYRYYEGAWEAMPEAIATVPFKVGTTAKFDLSAADRKVGYAFDYRGGIRIDQEGDYTFYTTSKAGSRLKVAGTTVVDNDCSDIRFGFPRPHEAKGLITLKHGVHPIHLMFYTDRFTPEPFLRVEYEGPGLARREVPAEVLYHPTPVSSVPAMIEQPRKEPGNLLALTL